MAEEERAAASNGEPVPLFLITSNTTRQNETREVTDEQRAESRASDRERHQTRINIGAAFHRWREIREEKGFKTDAEFATFLLDRDADFAKEGPSFSGAEKTSIQVVYSSVDHADHLTCSPGEDKGDVSASEEEEGTEKGNVSDDDEDGDWITPGFVCAAGGTSVTQNVLDPPESTSKEDTSHAAAESAEQPPRGTENEVQRNEPYHHRGNQGNDAAENHYQNEEHFDKTCLSSGLPSSQTEFTPPLPHNSTTKKVHWNRIKTEENHLEDHRPETQDQDHSATPAEQILVLSPEPTSEHSSFHYKTEEVKPDPELCRPKKTYKCQTCGREFPRFNALHRHLVIHSGKRPFKCFICGKGFTQSGNLKTHMKVHRGELPKWTLVQKKSQPEECAATVHVCGECGMDFPEKHQLAEHRESHRKPYACSDCGKRFKQENSVKIHKRLHSGDSLFFCSACGKSCTTASLLKIHMLTHTGEKNFHCDQCGRAFSRSCYLKLHLRTHTGERPHLCSICGKCYSRSDTLKAHLRVHTGENPYMCKNCGKCFCYYQGYRVHVKTHDKKPKTPTRPLGRPKQQLLVVNNQ